MKGSKNISAPETTAANGRSSDSATRSPRSRPVEGFALSGVSELPDPTTHAYRKDLADTALAGRVIASHYAEPLIRHLVANAALLAEPGEDDGLLAQLSAGDEMRVLDISRGWAWGYGPDGRVGYVRAEAVAP